MVRHKVHTTGEASPDTEIGRRVLDEIRALPGLSVTELKQRWHDLSGQEAPRFAKRSLLTQLVAWDIQAAAFGRLKPSLHRQLLDIGGGPPADGGMTGKLPPPALRPGVKLIRVWKGVTHHVIVTEDGFLWQGRTFTSLSNIARQITSTPWSGPVFFGLRKAGTRRPLGGQYSVVSKVAAMRIPPAHPAMELVDG